MGWMEGLCGVGVMLLVVFIMWVFFRFVLDDSISLKMVIIIYSVVYILLGISYVYLCCSELVGDVFEGSCDRMNC